MDNDGSEKDNCKCFDNLFKLGDENFCLTNTKTLIKIFSDKAVGLNRLSSSKREKSLPTEITHLDLILLEIIKIY